MATNYNGVDSEVFREQKDLDEFERMLTEEKIKVLLKNKNEKDNLPSSDKV